MATEIADLARPIDALPITHNSLLKETAYIEQAVVHLKTGRSQPALRYQALTLSTSLKEIERPFTAHRPEVGPPWEQVREAAGQLLEHLEALQTIVVQTEIRPS